MNAITAMKDDDIVGHVPHELFRVLYYFLKHSGEVSCVITDSLRKNVKHFINGFSSILILIAVKALRACNSATEHQIAKSKPSGSSLKHGESADSKNSILNFSRTSHVFSFSVTNYSLNE